MCLTEPHQRDFRTGARPGRLRRVRELLRALRQRGSGVSARSPRRGRDVAATLPGPSRTITVEPLEVPVPSEVPEPVPEEEPTPEPAEPAPQPEEPVPAP